MKNATNNFDCILELEEQLLSYELKMCGTCNASTNEFPSEQTIAQTFKYTHTILINHLIDKYMQKKCVGYKSSLFSDLFEGDLNGNILLPDNLDILNIPQLCEMLHMSYLNSTYCYSKGRITRKKSKSNLLGIGAVYTPDKIAYEIVHRTLGNLTVKNAQEIKILDFATGTGRFYRQIVKCLLELYELTPNFSILNNIYAVDIDIVAVNVCRINAMSLLPELVFEHAKIITEHIIIRNALLKEQLFDNNCMSIKHNDFGGLFNNGFDAIVSNPPYLVLKPNKKKMDADTIQNISNMASFFRNSGEYIYSIEGMLNLYQLSIEAMLGMLKKEGEMGIICPSTLFADVSATLLRKHLLSRHGVSYIKFFSENDTLFDNVTQATCIFHLTKERACNHIEIVQEQKNYQIALDDIKSVFVTNWEIPPIENIEWNILRKLLSIPQLKSLSHIRNKRGELDLTSFKKYISTEPTQLRLVRGNMILGNSLVDINHEYVKPDFFNKKSIDYLSNDKGRRRLVCQQISNMTQKVRLKFVECECNDVLGNSCNYITIAEEKMLQMKLILNSALLNWRFKVTSTNNHVNNYELDELPIIDLDLVSSEIVELDEISQDKRICTLYGLEESETNFIIKNRYEII